MVRENFYTGEPIQNGSPPDSIYMTEQEAIESASFGKYDYEPGMRMAYQSAPNVYSTSYGYNNQPNHYYQQQNFYNPGAPNPVFANQQYNQPQYIQQQQPRYIYIQPYNPSGTDYLPNANFQDEIDRLRYEYWQAEQETCVDTNNNGYYGGNNYYGVPYGNPYYGNQASINVSRKIQEMQEQARENRIQLNIQLSKAAHACVGDDITDEEIEDLYRGRQIEINPEYYESYNMAERFSRMVPFDNSAMYRAIDAQISAEFNAIIPKDADMQTTFSRMNIVNAMWELEEEQHRRRNGAALYDQNAYRYFIRAKASERKMNGGKKRNMPTITIPNGMNYQYDMVNRQYGTQDVGPSVDIKSNNGIDPILFPRLAESATLSEDGTLNITCNFGAGNKYSVHNSEEAAYEDKRKRMIEFYNSVPGAIYLDKSSKPPSGGADDG